MSEPQLCERVRELLQQSVRRQIVADVPVGAFLSAGMDSSSVVRLMAGAGPRVSTYTITFPRKYRVGEGTLDDPAVPRKFAGSLGCDHHEIVLEPDVVNLLPRLIWHMDEPAADPAIIAAYLVCRNASASATVLLSGTGGDELFAGYRKHYAYYWARLYRACPSVARRWLIEPVIRALPPALGTRFKDSVRLIKKMARSGSLSAVDAFLMNCTYLDRGQKDALYNRDINAQLRDNDPWDRHRDYFSRVSHADFLNQMLYLDTKAFLVSLNLTYMDKMSMASSTEVRVPFLDRDLVEFAASQIPPRLKLHGTVRPTTKYILRKAMTGLLPAEVLRQKKAAFGAPVSYWLSYDLHEMIGDLLSEDRIRRTGYLDPAAVSHMVWEHQAGRRDWSQQIWQLLTFELWVDAFMRNHAPVGQLTAEAPVRAGLAGANHGS